MGLFDKKKEYPRRELRDTFRRDSGIIPRTGGKKYYEAERKGMVDKTFSKKYGSQNCKNYYRGAIRDLGAAKRQAKTFRERREIDKRIGYLKRMGGIR